MNVWPRSPTSEIETALEHELRVLQRVTAIVRQTGGGRDALRAYLPPLPQGHPNLMSFYGVSAAE